MNTMLTAICGPSGTGRVIRVPGADARLAPRGPQGPGQGNTRVAQGTRAWEEARWQRILDLLDPGKTCGAWAPATIAGRPVVCTRAPHDAREDHANADTGCCWSENPDVIPE
jgi:hypothetical protein